MDDKGGKGANGGEPPAPRERAPLPEGAPIGGMVRDPRDDKESKATPPSITRYVRTRVAHAIAAFLVALGLIRPRNPDGTLGPRKWKRLGALCD